MGNTNTIPVVSQIKSTVQLITGDVHGAAETQEKFFHEGIGVSQLTAGVYLLTGDDKKAGETFDRGINTLSSTADGIPVVGHFKGVIHYAMGDDEKGDRSMVSATRTTSVMAGGAGGFLLGGPVGAIAGGVASGNAYDITHTVVTDKPQGYIAGVANFVENPSAGTLFDAAAVPVGDAFAGYQAGNIVKSIQNTGKSSGNSSGPVDPKSAAKAADLHNKANVALETAESMGESGKFNSGQVKAQYDVAHNYFKEAQVIENGGKPVSVFDPKAPNAAPKPQAAGAVFGQKQNEQENEEKARHSYSTTSSRPTTSSSSSGNSQKTRPQQNSTETEQLNSDAEFRYYKELLATVEAYKNFNPEFDISQLVNECKQVLKGKGVPIQTTSEKFKKVVFTGDESKTYNYQKEQVVSVVYDTQTAEDFDEECPLKGFQVIIQHESETRGALHTLLSHPQDMQRLLKNLDTSAYPAFYQKLFTKNSAKLTEKEKNAMVREAIQYYSINPAARQRMMQNELRLTSFLTTHMKSGQFSFHQYYMDDSNPMKTVRRLRVVFNVPTLSGKTVQLCICLSCASYKEKYAIVYQSPGKDGVERDCFEIITAFIYD